MIITSSDAYLAIQEEQLNAPLFAYDNLVTSTNVAAGNSATGYPATNLANPATFLKWKANTTASQSLTIDLTGNTQQIDYIAIAKHNFYTAGVDVTIRGDTGSGLTEIVPQFSLSDDGVFLARFEAAAYVEISIDLSAASVAAEAAVLYCGTLLPAERNIYVGYAPMTLSRDSDSVAGFSENGNYLGRIEVNSSRSGQITLNNLTPAWVRSSLVPFLEEAKSRPFFFAWRPDTYPDEVVYAWQTDTNGPYPSNSLPNGMMQFSMNVKAIV